MGVELVFLERDGLANGLALPFCIGSGETSRLHAHLDLRVIGPARHAQGFEYRSELGNRLVGTGNDLLGDRRAFERVAFEKSWCRLSLQNGGQFPGEIESVLY